MKFKLLSLGQKFEYEGESYVKTSPLIASNIKTSHNKMIPRYAVLKLLDDSGEIEKAIKKETLETGEILKAFNLFYENCINTLEKHNALIPKIKDELDKVRDEFKKTLLEK